jgi:hypothetical protein
MAPLNDIVPPGVVTGDNLIKLLEHAKDNGYAIPAFNCTRFVFFVLWMRTRAQRFTRLNLTPLSLVACLFFPFVLLFPLLLPPLLLSS